MIFGIASGKGGVGKSTLVANLGLALAELGVKTLIVDGNLTNGNLSCILGTPFPEISLQDVMLRRATLEDAVFSHPRGVKLISSALQFKEALGAGPEHLRKLDKKKLLGMADVVLLDTPGTLGWNTVEVMKLVDRLAIITTPDVTSYTDAVKTRMLARKLGIGIEGAILNKSTAPYGKAREEVQGWLALPLLANLPFDNEVQRANAKGIPPVHYNVVGNYSMEIRKLAAHIANMEYKAPNIVERLVGRFFRKGKF